MKKVLITFLLFTISFSTLYAAETLTATALNTASKISDEAIAIDKGYQNQKYPYYKDLKLKIDTLDSNSDLDLFYKESKIPVLWPTLKSLVLGFGSGAKSQGQVLTSRVFFNIDTSIITYGLGAMATVWIVLSVFSSSTSSVSQDIDGYAPILQLMGAGLIISHGIQALNNFFYGIGYNIRLKRDLNLIASINPVDKSFTIGKKLVLS